MDIDIYTRYNNPAMCYVLSYHFILERVKTGLTGIWNEENY